MRATVPYEVETEESEYVVGAMPTKATRSVHGTGFNIGLSFMGEKGTEFIPVQRPYAGQGLESKAFPYYQPSRVAPDAIKPALFINFNRYSPVSHPDFRYEFSKTLPAMAQIPLTRMPGVNNANRRPSGSIFTTPFPMSYPDFPTSLEWLSQKMRDNQV